MTNLFPIQKQQEHPIFGRFNARYGDIIVEHCPPLNKFQINVLTVEEFRKNPGELPVIEIDDADAFAYSSDLQDDDVASTKAGIIFNQSRIDALGLTEEEQYAAIAHEIGHIIYRFSSLKQMFPGEQGQEIYAEEAACIIELASPLFSLLDKLEHSGFYSDAQRRFGSRKKYIKCMFLDIIDE